MVGPVSVAPRSGESRLGQAGREVLRRTEATTGVDLRPRLRALRAALHRRGVGQSAVADEVAQLRADVQELRGLGGRVAELADLVTELLVVAAKREDPEFQALVTKYLEGV
jgi:hypothetical protein